MRGQTKTYTTIFLFIILFHNTSLGDIQIKLTIIMLLPEVWINDNIERSNRKKSETEKRQVASLLTLCLLTVTPVTTSNFSSQKFKQSVFGLQTAVDISSHLLCTLIKQYLATFPAGHSCGGTLHIEEVLQNYWR